MRNYFQSMVTTVLIAACTTAMSTSVWADEGTSSELSSPAALVEQAMTMLLGDIKKRKNRQQLYALVAPSYFESQGISERERRKLKVNMYSSTTGFDVVAAAGPIVDVRLDINQCASNDTCTILRFRVGKENGNYVLVPGRPVDKNDYVSVWEVSLREDYTEPTDEQRNSVIEVVAVNSVGKWPWELDRHVPPRDVPIDQGAVVEDNIAVRLAAGEKMPDRVEDPGYAIANCKSTHLPANGWLSDGRRNYICENTDVGQAIIAWRAWYCEDQPRCVLGRWPGGRFPANSAPMEYTIRANLGAVSGASGNVVLEIRPPTWQPTTSNPRE